MNEDYSIDYEAEMEWALNFIKVHEQEYNEILKQGFHF